MNHYDLISLILSNQKQQYSFFRQSGKSKTNNF